MDSLQDRLSKFITFKGISYRTFERQCDIKAGTSYKMTANSYRSTFQRIQNTYPELNLDWLKTGEGEMLNPQPAERYEVGIGIGKQQGGRNDFKIDIKESDGAVEVKEEEQIICDLKREIQHLKEMLAMKDETIDMLKASVARLEKLNDIMVNKL